MPVLLTVGNIFEDANRRAKLIPQLGRDDCIRFNNHHLGVEDIHKARPLEMLALVPELGNALRSLATDQRRVGQGIRTKSNMAFDI